MKRVRIDRFQAVLLIIVIVYSIFVAAKNPSFLKAETIFDIARVASTMMIVTIGLLVVMISGGIDVSFMSIALFGSYTAINIMIQTGIDHLWFAFFLSSVIGGALGLINAGLINWLKLPPFIITLGTQNLFHGIMTTFIGDRSFGAGVLPKSIHRFGSLAILEAGDAKLTAAVIPVICIGGVTWFLLHRTMVGRGIFAIGNSEESARRIGFDPAKIRLFVYAYSGILAGIMGILYVAQTNALYPNKLVGDELIVVAAVVIGGTKITGGQGKVLGAVLGVLIINLLNTTLIMIGLSASWNNLFIGTILVISVAITSLQEKVKNRKNLIFTE